MNVPFSYASPTLSVEALKHSIAYKLMFMSVKIRPSPTSMNGLTPRCLPFAIAWWSAGRAPTARSSPRSAPVYYLSMEFLIGTASNALLSLGIYDDVSSALAEMGSISKS